MIRIDEIYNNTIWPWMQQNLPGKRVFFCDPPGHTSPDNLFNLGSDTVKENGYLFFHDQEPIDSITYKNLFTEVQERNDDLYASVHYNVLKNVCAPFYPRCRKMGLDKIGAIITSELGENLNNVIEHRHWKSYYYFFHGWAALDWYRGYDKTFLRQPTNIQHTFLLPNNIIGGNRKHRLALFVELEKRNLIKNNLISFPKICPHENVSAVELCKQYNLPTIKTELPLILDTFDNHANTSHSITLWEQSARSLLQIVTETVFYGERLHLTEKTFKPIAMGQPFVLASCRGSLEYLKSYGFQTFDRWWSEEYDNITDNDGRLKAIADVVNSIGQKSTNELEQMRTEMLDVLDHNFKWFYNGFSDVVWSELKRQLGSIYG